MLSLVYCLLLGLLVTWGDAQRSSGSRYNAWAAGSVNCSCTKEINALKRELLHEIHNRQELKGALETYVTELYELRATVRHLKNDTRGKTNLEKQQQNKQKTNKQKQNKKPTKQNKIKLQKQQNNNDNPKQNKTYQNYIIKFCLEIEAFSFHICQYIYIYFALQSVIIIKHV